MSSGSAYVNNRFAYDDQYVAVAAYSVNSAGNTIPSGASVVQGIYYMWNELGFTGQGWMTGISGSPTNMFNDGMYANNEDAFAEYAASVQNLNDVFSQWAENYTLEGWDNFYAAVGVDSGCMDVVHSQSMKKDN